MIATVAFRRFKALRNAHLALAPFNLIIGPNGSGKSSLIQSLLRLRTLARLPLRAPPADTERLPEGPEITFTFGPPNEGTSARLSCLNDRQCDLLEVTPFPRGSAGDGWSILRERLLGLRAYLFDYYAMALPSPRHDHTALNSNGGNLSAILARWEQEQPEAFAQVAALFRQMIPEFDQIGTVSRDGGTVELALRLAEGGELVLGEALSQGTLHALALCVLASDPAPPALICIEEVDRGIHPRLLRYVRDALYRLSYPASQGLGRAAVQVIVTTHSPYLLDQYREHPEEVVIAGKHGAAATFQRLADHPALEQLLAEATLGDMWFSGILGGVPDES